MRRRLARTAAIAHWVPRPGGLLSGSAVPAITAWPSRSYAIKILAHLSASSCPSHVQRPGEELTLASRQVSATGGGSTSALTEFSSETDLEPRRYATADRPAIGPWSHGRKRGSPITGQTGPIRRCDPLLQTALTTGQDSQGDGAQTKKSGRHEEVSRGRHPDLLHWRRIAASAVYVAPGSRRCRLRAALPRGAFPFGWAPTLLSREVMTAPTIGCFDRGRYGPEARRPLRPRERKRRMRAIP